jgi:hypothetical protein
VQFVYGFLKVDVCLRCRVLDAKVYGAQPAEHDKTLYASDHAAVKATLEVRAVPAPP